MEKNPEPSNEPTDKLTSPTDQEDKPGDGLGVGINVGSFDGGGFEILDEADAAASEDPGKGLGTGGNIKAPKRRV
jgi:hypothetical protein